MASPVPAEFVPLGIEPPNAPNFADPQLIGNIYEHVENLPMENLRSALDAFLAYKEGLLRRVLQAYVIIKAIVNVFGLGIIGASGSTIFLVKSEAKELSEVMLAIPLKEENSRALLNALLLLYANDRVSTQNGATVDAPGVFLMHWLTCCDANLQPAFLVNYGGSQLDGLQLKGWFTRADDLKIDTFLVMPPGRALADCCKKLSSLNDSDALVNPKIQRPQEPEAPSAGELEVEWEEWLRTWTKENENPGVHRMRLYKVLDALRLLRTASPRVTKFRGYNTEHFMGLLEDLGNDVSDAIEEWAKMPPDDLPSIEEAETWGAKVDELCLGVASYPAAMRSALGLVKRVVRECGKNSAQVRAPKRQRM